MPQSGPDAEPTNRNPMPRVIENIRFETRWGGTVTSSAALEMSRKNKCTDSTISFIVSFMHNSIMRTLMTRFLEELGEDKAVPETAPSHPRPRQASVAGEEQRQSKRYESTGDIVLSWKDLVKGRVGSSALARNVSKYGLQVEVSVPVPVPTVVRLSGQTLECVGSTRYCRTVEDAVQETYLVGIRILGQPYPKKEERQLHELRLTSRSPS